MFIIIQGEYFVTHRFPDFFKIQKLFSSTVQGSQNKPATGSFHWLFRIPRRLYSAVLVLGFFYAWYCGNKTVHLIISWKPNRNRCNNILLEVKKYISRSGSLVTVRVLTLILSFEFISILLCHFRNTFVYYDSEKIL